MLHGRKFGVTFTIVVSITSFRVLGELPCCFYPYPEPELEPEPEPEPELEPEP